MNPQPRPKISRKPIVLLVSLCLIVSAVLIPVGAHLPRWVEIELVLGAWWGIWVIALTILLYTGHAVDDNATWKGFSLERTQQVFGWAGAGEGCGWLSCGDIGIAIIVLLLGAVALIAVIELIVPAIALLLLASIGGMFARAINDSHNCDGRFGVSLFWGTLWATVYIGPFTAIATWVANYLAHRS